MISSVDVIAVSKFQKLLTQKLGKFNYYLFGFVFHEYGCLKMYSKLKAKTSGAAQ